MFLAAPKLAQIFVPTDFWFPKFGSHWAHSWAAKGVRLWAKISDRFFVKFQEKLAVNFGVQQASTRPRIVAAILASQNSKEKF